MNVADTVISFLAACGVRHVFGYPGSPLVPLLAALRRQSVVEWILMRHENAAALAAAAQAKLTGRLAVCLATSGPGALQTVCGVADAHYDRAPLLALTGVVSRRQQGHWGFQDVDQTSLYTTILEQSVACVASEQVVAVLRKLTGHALLHQQAVHLALPFDVLDEPIDPADELFDLSGFTVPNLATNVPTPDDLDRAGGILSGCAPVIVVGRRAVGAGPAIEALSEQLDAPIVATLDGKGIVREHHPNYLGVLGIFGHPAIKATRKVVQDSDCIVAFGVDHLRFFLSDGRHVQKRRVIQTTPIAATASLEYSSDAILIGDQSAIARALTTRVRPCPDGHVAHDLAESRERVLTRALDEVGDFRAADTTNPLTFLLALNRFLDERSLLVVDTGSHTVWAALFLRLDHRQPFLVSNRLGTMGFSLPALIAAQLTAPDTRAVAICGDGGLGMTGMELATAVQHRLPIVLVIINNGVLQNVMAQQDQPFGCDLHNPDVVAFAESFGAAAAAVDGTTDVDEVLRRAFATHDRPFVIDVRCNPALLAPYNKWEQDV